MFLFFQAVFSFIGMFSAFVPVKAAMICSFLLSLQVLFTGLLVDLSYSGIKKEFSIFYWVRFYIVFFLLILILSKIDSHCKL